MADIMPTVSRPMFRAVDDRAFRLRAGHFRKMLPDAQHHLGGIDGHLHVPGGVADNLLQHGRLNPGFTGEGDAWRQDFHDLKKQVLRNQYAIEHDHTLDVCLTGTKGLPLLSAMGLEAFVDIRPGTGPDAIIRSRGRAGRPAADNLFKGDVHEEAEVTQPADFRMVEEMEALDDHDVRARLCDGVVYGLHSGVGIILVGTFAALIPVDDRGIGAVLPEAVHVNERSLNPGGKGARKSGFPTAGRACKSDDGQVHGHVQVLSVHDS
ncbi:hypothetical protein AD929_01925 [Gluconobacter potus]|uniref:Uncharacterized protein n=1 Tax=Gluconobacter potus TaxID=2724927 RepID=A0A149QZJ0_9PROT|nr:hypothetical protein AD929_01925 [Gluconobacter potus]